MRKRKKSVVQKGGGAGVGVGVGVGFMNGANGNGNMPAACNIGTLKKDFKKEALYIDPASWHPLQPVEYIHVDRETTVWYVAAGCGLYCEQLEQGLSIAWLGQELEREQERKREPEPSLEPVLPVEQLDIICVGPVQDLAWRF